MLTIYQPLVTYPTDFPNTVNIIYTLRISSKYGSVTALKNYPKKLRQWRWGLKLATASLKNLK
jgi:hypothetical protein